MCTPYRAFLSAFVFWPRERDISVHFAISRAAKDLWLVQSKCVDTVSKRGIATSIARGLTSSTKLVVGTSAYEG